MFMTLNIKTTSMVYAQLFGSMLVDSIVMALSYFFAFLLRYDFGTPLVGWRQVAFAFIPVWAIQLTVLILFRCYKVIWRYISGNDVPRFLAAVGVSSLIFLGLRYIMPNPFSCRPPYSITFFNAFMVTGGLLSVRLFWRLVVEGYYGGAPASGIRHRVLLVGAGSVGNLIARELRSKCLKDMKVVGFVDDDPSKKNARIQGYSVLGTVDHLSEIVCAQKVDEVIVSMARVPRSLIRRIVMLCETSHVPARIVPGYYELINGSVTVSKIRNIDVNDLLGREETHVDSNAVIELLHQKRVMITGAGGSIGSEIVRQVLQSGPEQLILVEHSERALYEIDREVRKMATPVSVISVLGDITDRQRMAEIFLQLHPQIVLHAAAYKHVPLSEQNPSEALKNNVLGTRVLGELALEHGVERFVLVSTDKAVRPVSVMGATKRLAEIAIQDLNRQKKTCFSAVRFGNVLDSSGSVVPLFREQIIQGEPVTVTHPEMRRYFMTISEAVSLVLQAAALAQGGEIFVLDMGEPVRIVDLAEEMIALAGLRPYEDVPIHFVGIRPGEKLFEELDVSERSAYRTGHTCIFISKLEEVSHEKTRQLLATCEMLCARGHETAESIRTHIRNMVAS
jgi:FlaA1/EpsC-like NDP-sugar epimerase